MTYFYKFIIALIILAGAYTLFGIGHFKWMHHNIKTPDAEFLVYGDKNSDLTVVEFLNYDCGYCKDLHPVMTELAQVRKDVRYVVRPIAFDYDAPEEGKDSPTPYKDMITRYAIAAGLQGKFSEFHDAFLEHPKSEISDDFVQEISLLYGVDYDQLIKDADGKKAQKIIDGNLAALEHANVTSVPSFIINRDIYVISDDALPDLKQLLNLLSEHQ